MTNDERALKGFLAAYFNEDWSLDAESPDAVVDEFIFDHNSTDALHPIVRALHVILSSQEPDDMLSSRLCKEFGCYFDPQGAGGSTRVWLQAVSDKLEREIDRRSSSEGVV